MDPASCRCRAPGALDWVEYLSTVCVMSNGWFAVLEGGMGGGGYSTVDPGYVRPPQNEQDMSRVAVLSACGGKRPARVHERETNEYGRGSSMVELKSHSGRLTHQPLMPTI
eukprot:scaffold4935_cov67-Phaeocystis_antarctica.AAC.3